MFYLIFHLLQDSPSNKLLFAKDISRYKNMVQRFFQEIQDKPSVSDQDLNCYLTENVSQVSGVLSFYCIYILTPLAIIYNAFL